MNKPYRAFTLAGLLFGVLLVATTWAAAGIPETTGCQLLGIANALFPASLGFYAAHISNSAYRVTTSSKHQFRLVS